MGNIIYYNMCRFRSVYLAEVLINVIAFSIIAALVGKNIGWVLLLFLIASEYIFRNKASWLRISAFLAIIMILHTPLDILCVNSGVFRVRFFSTVIEGSIIAPRKEKLDAQGEVENVDYIILWRKPSKPSTDYVLLIEF